MEQSKLILSEAYKVGDIVDYKVRATYSNYCELIDEKTGITSYLQGTAKLILFKGQTVQCRVIALGEKHPMIELVNISDFEQTINSLTESNLVNLLETRNLSWNTKDFVKLILTEEREKSFELQCHQWIYDLLQRKIDLHLVRQDCVNLLEFSEFLNICSCNERDFYQERLTLLIEQIGYYIKADEIINGENQDQNTNTPDAFVDSLFNKLKVSGFVYHPNKNFNILSCLFRRKPVLMHNRIKELLDIICSKDIKIWEKEPFSSSLIKLLELYIKESEGLIDKTKDNKILIDNNILVLAVQLLLFKNSSNQNIIDYRLNAARLCILCSYLYLSDRVSLIDVAYYTLFSSNINFPVYKIEDIDKLPYYISCLRYDKIDTVCSYSQGNGRLLISEDGIHLQISGENGNQRSVFPTELGLWKNLQVFLPLKTEVSLASVKPNDILPYQSVWSEIENELFYTKAKPASISNTPKRQHRIEDEVRISFLSQDCDDRDKYYCQIEDEIGGKGFIFVKDIVPYSISTSLRHFYSADGSRLVFNAKIIDKEDDLFRFSMCDEIKSYFSEDYYSDDEDIICSVGNVPNLFGMSPAISKEGVSVSLRNAGDFKGIEKGSIVSCKFVSAGKGTFHILCDIEDFTDSGFDMNTAFKNLMSDFSIDRIPEDITQLDEEQIQKSDKLLDETYVKEVVYLIDRMALLESDYIKSFNYLGFARILCLLIGDETQAAYYKGRMDIIVMLHDFAQNSKVDEEKLAKLKDANAELFSNNVILYERFMQLQTVSYIGNEEHNSDLFALASSNPTLKNLASLVLAYNITNSNGLESSATNIHNKIIQLLNLKGYEIGLKLYGTGIETEEVEYKTSIVFPAGDNQPNPGKQMDEILKVINSFFNTKGGILYVGVNNFGFGIGVEEDLKTCYYYGDKDKYIMSILDAIVRVWGNEVATTYIKSIAFDEENDDKDVLIIQVLPIPSGISYNDTWYVRKAGSKRKMTQKEFEGYQKLNRNQPTVVIEKSVDEVPLPNQESVTTMESFHQSKDDKIKTSRIRKNVLEEWEDPDNYVEPICLFKFLSGGKFKKIDNYDYDYDSLLTLVVKDSEKKGYMVLGYENGHIVKVSVDELIGYMNREYSRNMNSRLIFASLANEGDAVLIICKENKANPKIVMRLDSLSNFQVGKLMDKGVLPFNEGLVDKVLAYDVIPKEYVKDFKNIFDKPKTFSGYPANNSTNDMIRRLHSWGIQEI